MRILRAAWPLGAVLSGMIAVLSAAAATAISSAGPTDEDPRDRAWSTAFGVPGVTGVVNCLTSFGDALILGGRFDYAGAVAARNVALYDATGWHALGDTGFGDGADVRAAAVFRNQLVVAGSVVGLGNVRRAAIQSWDGNAWTPLAVPGAGPGESGIRCLTVYHDELIVGGGFTQLDGVACNNIARWDGSQWHALGAGTAGNSGVVNALTVWNDQLIAAGDFARAGGQFASRIAAWDGSQWHGVGYGVLGVVECVGVYQGELIAGGWFDYADGRPARRIARWNGVEWAALGAGIDSGNNASPVYALGEMNGVLVVAGIFDQAGGVGSENVAFWNGSRWSAPPRGIEPGAGLSYVRAIHTHAGRTYLGGWFTAAGGERAVNIAQLDPSGAFHGLGGAQGINGYVQAVINGSAGEVVAGGWFDWAGTTRARAVARWDGSKWSPYAAGLDRPVAALLQTPTGLIAGGEFRTSGLDIVRYVARWKDPVWEPMSVGFDAPVQALASYKGDVVAGGDFSASGATKLSGVARWDGAAWQPLGQEFPGANGVFVRDLAVQGDDLYAAGWLYKDDGPVREFVARWDGAVWTVWDAPHATAVLRILFLGGQLVAGVAASQDNGPMPLVWAWDGKNWSAVGGLYDGWVTALAIRDGVLCAGTTNYADSGSNVWTWTGGEWAALASRIHGHGGVRALLPVANGMYAGGSFARVGTRPAGSFAFWSAVPVPVAIQDLRATGLDTGLRVEWRCALPGIASAAVQVQRAAAAAGPFAPVSGWLAAAPVMSFDDPGVPAGPVWYRIAVRDASGAQTLSAAVAAPEFAARGAVVWLAAARRATGGGAMALRYSTGTGRGAMTLALYDVRGRLVRMLVRGPCVGGVQVTLWDGTDDRGRRTSRGIYVARLEAGGAVRSVRVPWVER